MYLSKLTINPAYPSVMRDVADVARLHKRLMKAFPDIEQVDARHVMGMLFRVESGMREVAIYVQSAVEPDWSRLEPRSLLMPPQVKSIGQAIGSIQNGRILRFRIKANPTKRTRAPGKEKGKRVGLVREEDQIAWLRRRAVEAGFEVNKVLIRKDGLVSTRDGKAFESAVFEGTLTVIDRDSLLRAVRSGIGSGKAYGFGLLSLAPAGAGWA